MAYLPQNQDDENQQGQDNNQVPNVPQIPSLQGTSGPGVAGSTGSGAITNTASPAAAPSAPWQNVSAYLNANAGQGAAVADKIAAGITQQYNQANQAIGQAQTDYNQKIEGARNPYQESLANSAAQGAAAFSQDPNNVASFQKMWGGQYGGPQNFSGTQDYSNLVSQVEKGQKYANLAHQGTPGLMTLLQKTEGAQGRNPTQGVTALDALLLQESPDNFNRISAATQPFSGLTSYLGQTQQGLDAAANAAAQEAAQTGNTIQNKFIGPGGVVQQWNQRENQQLQDMSKQAGDYNTQVADIISRLNAGRPLTDQQIYNLDQSGLLYSLTAGGNVGLDGQPMDNPASNSGIFQKILAGGYPVGPGFLGNFFNPGMQVGQPGPGAATSAQEMADAIALNQLMGQDAVQYGTPQSFNVPSTFGGYDAQAATQGLYDQLSGLFGSDYIASIPVEKANALRQYTNQLGSWLGIPSNDFPNPTAPPPIEDPGTPPPYTPPPTGGGGTIFSRPIF